MTDNDNTACDRRSGFTFFRSYREAAGMLPPKQRLALYEALMDYGLDSEQPAKNDTIKAMFMLIKPVLDRSIARIEAGAKGGRSKEKPAEPKQPASKPQAKRKPPASKREQKQNIEAGAEAETETRSEEQEQEPPRAERGEPYGWPPDAEHPGTPSAEAEDVAIATNCDGNGGDGEPPCPPGTPPPGGEYQRHVDTDVIFPALDGACAIRSAKCQGGSCQQVLDLYNRLCADDGGTDGQNPPGGVNVLSSARKKALEARFKAGFALPDFQRLFEMAKQSDFLRGGGSRGWHATFDWLIDETNMAKVLGGNYSNRSQAPPQAAGDGGTDYTACLGRALKRHGE